MNEALAPLRYIVDNAEKVLQISQPKNNMSGNQWFASSQNQDPRTGLPFIKNAKNSLSSGSKKLWSSVRHIANKGKLDSTNYSCDTSLDYLETLASAINVQDSYLIALKFLCFLAVFVLLYALFVSCVLYRCLKCVLKRPTYEKEIIDVVDGTRRQIRKLIIEHNQEVIEELDTFIDVSLKKQQRDHCASDAKLNKLFKSLQNSNNNSFKCLLDNIELPYAQLHELRKEWSANFTEMMEMQRKMRQRIDLITNRESNDELSEKCLKTAQRCTSAERKLERMTEQLSCFEKTTSTSIQSLNTQSTLHSAKLVNSSKLAHDTREQCKDNETKIDDLYAQLNVYKRSSEGSKRANKFKDYDDVSSQLDTNTCSASSSIYGPTSDSSFSKDTRLKPANEKDIDGDSNKDIKRDDEPEKGSENSNDSERVGKRLEDWFLVKESSPESIVNAQSELGDKTETLEVSSNTKTGSDHSSILSIPRTASPSTQLTPTNVTINPFIPSNQSFDPVE